MSYAKQLNRKELVAAVWSAEFARVLGSLGATASTSRDAAMLRRLAEVASKNADRAVEVLRLLLDVEFRLAEARELNDCYMSWDEFVSCCETNAFTDDDGHGELATSDHHVSNVRVHPSEAVSKSYVRPDWATHVCWYNK